MARAYRWWIAIAVVLLLGLATTFSVTRNREARRAALIDAVHLRTQTSRLTVLRFALRGVRDAELAYRHDHGSFTSDYDALGLEEEVPGVLVDILMATADSFVAVAEDIGARTRCHVYWGGYPAEIELDDRGQGLVGCFEIPPPPAEPTS